jgi:hypothetical protein
MLLQGPLLTWGSSEGTDMAAAGLALSALLLGERPRLAGALLGLALSFRWTAAAWALPLAITLPVGGLPRAAGGALLGFLPHLVGSAWGGGFVWPDQSLNLAIAAGPGAPQPGLIGILGRVPHGLQQAAPYLLPGIASRAGAALLLLNAALPARTPEGRALRRLAGAMALGALVHALGLAAVFANARLALPSTLAALAGFGLAGARVSAEGLAPRRVVVAAMLGIAALSGLWSVPALRVAPPGAAFVSELGTALANCPSRGAATLANNALVHTVRDGWLVPAVQLGGLRITPRTTPAALGRIADDAGISVLVLDPARARGQPGLAPLARGDATAVDGWARCANGPLRVWTRSPPPNPG